MSKIIKGVILTPTKDEFLKIYNPGYMAVSDLGKIEEISEDDLSVKYSSYEFLDFKDNLIIPGLIDTHNHLPQYAFAGLDGGQLLQWLENFTFPREGQFSNEDIAREAAKIFFRDLLKNGTTTTVTYSTVHKNATDLAFQEAEKSGIRAVIGKVMMDQNSPNFLQEDIDKSLIESEELIQKWHKKNNMLFYAVTPRFAITCSFNLLKRAAKLRDKYDTYLQTHLSESLGEVEKVKELYCQDGCHPEFISGSIPKFKNYLDVYDKAGLLSDKTLMAHCIYLSESELKVLKDTKTKVLHCPTCNRFMRSGIMNYKKYSEFGLSISLGTDVAGGYSLSMFNEIKETIENSKTLSLICGQSSIFSSCFNLSDIKPVSVEQAFYSATLGGAKCLSLENETGSLEANKAADFVVIDTDRFENFLYKKPLQLLTKAIYSDALLFVNSVFINGKSVL